MGGNTSDGPTILKVLLEAVQRGEDLGSQREKWIGELRQLQKEFARCREKALDFEEIGKHLYDGIYIADGQGTTLYINEAFTRITGILPEEVVGRNVRDILKEGKLYNNGVTLDVIKHKKRVNSVASSLKNGKKMLVTGSPILDEQGHVKMVVINNREMTDLLRIKEELEASLEKIDEVKQDRDKTRREADHLRRRSVENSGLVGESPAIQEVAGAIEQVSQIDVTVLLVGETGVGKEVVANEIYKKSRRNQEPFIKVNCAAIPGNLLESELFGYERGAFTGASTVGKPGLFEAANKGTILLDEIAEMPMELQSKLLRVLQQKEVVRVGGTKVIKLDVRILAATNKDLGKQVAQGQFREDLYYRLNVIPIHIPPLRQRVDDIDLLVSHYLHHFNKKYEKEVQLTPAHIEMMKRYAWPGNIRELQNIVERLVVVSDARCVADIKLLANILNMELDAMLMEQESDMGFKELLAKVEKKLIENALKQYGSTRKAAAVLKLDQSTIVKKAKKLGIVLKA